MRPPDFARGHPRQFALPRQRGELEDRYGALDSSGSLATIYDHVAGLGATHVLLEHEYLDADYRDEYSNFYSKTFRWVPDRCERLHFWAGFRYIGYCSIRPIKGRPVGRTMLHPGTDLKEHVSCVMSARAHPYGRELSVSAFPFVSQDSQYGSCAHAVIWMICHYHRHVNGTPEWFLSDIVNAAARDETERVVPSGGLTDDQIGSVLQRLGLGAVRYNIRLGEEGAREEVGTGADDGGEGAGDGGEGADDGGEGADDGGEGADDGGEGAVREPKTLTVSQVEGILLRYLNSRIPLVLGMRGRTHTENADQRGHTSALIGALRTDSGEIRVISCDDQLAPYTLKAIDLSDGDGAWEMLFVPLPEKIFLLGEVMTPPAIDEFAKLLARAGEDTDAALENRSFRVRAYVIDSRIYKQQLALRGVPTAAAKAHVQVATDRWIWVLELQDADIAQDSRDCVLGEIAVDATSDEHEMNFLFANVPGLRASWVREEIEPRTVLEPVGDFAPYETGTALNL